jgi:hypothetical protein
MHAERLAGRRRGVGLQRSVTHAEVASPLRRARDGDEVRQIAGAGQLPADDRAVARIDERRHGAVAGVDVLGAQLVPGQRVADAAQDGEPVGTTGQPRQVLAHLDAGHVGVDRPELAAKLRGRVRLHVERIHVRRAAAEEDEDRRGRPRPANLLRLRGPQVTGERQPRAEGADAHEVAPRDAVAETVSRHDGRLLSLECGDSSPLYCFRKRIQSGDKSPHSKISDSH